MPPTPTKASALYPEDISGFLCLPPVSDDLQVVWSRAELTEELDDNPQLISSFSFFPYPSMPEIALLALRYGLKMDQVKNWFMVQRIRCGISWSPEEIEETRAKLDYNQEQLHFKPLMALARKSNVLRSEEFSIPVLKAKAKEALSSTRFCSSSGNNAPRNEAPESKRRKLNCDTPEKEPVRVNTSTPVQRINHSSRDVKSDFTSNSPVANLLTKSRPSLHNQVIPSSTAFMLGVDGREVNRSVVSYQRSEEEQLSSSWNASNGEMQLASYIDQNGNIRRDLNNSRRQRKTKQQLQILKAFFLKCQWASREDYMMLEEVTGLSKAEIIQWFGDTRYALKNGHLRWFQNSTQERPAWLDDLQFVGNVNGRHNEAGPLCLAAVSAVREILDEDVTASSSQRFGNTAVIEEISEDEPTFSGKSKSAHKVSNFKLKVKNNFKTPQRHTLASLQSYDVLESYQSANRRLQAHDMEDLVAESGLSHQQVLDWFADKSKDSDELEICIVEDEDEDEVEEDEVEEDDDDDVVVQD